MRYYVGFMHEGINVPQVEVDAASPLEAISKANPPAWEGTAAALAWVPQGEVFPKTVCYQLKEGKWELYSQT